VLRKQFIGLSFLSILSLWTKKVFGDHAEKPEKKMILLKKYFLCNGNEGSFDFDLSPYYTTAYAYMVSAVPTGFTDLYNKYGSLYGFSIAPGTANGIYEIVIAATELGGGDVTEFMLKFQLATDCAAEIATCCDESAVGIRWLGREGGIKQWNFSGVKTFDVEVGDANTFKNSDMQLQYSQRKDIYNGKLVTTGNITKAQADFLDEVKYAIQVWEWTDSDTPGTFYAIPITVNNDSFTKYKSRDKLFDVSLKYVISQEVIIQTQ